MSDVIPLRKTTEWNSFREEAVIPHRYGESSGSLLQYDSNRKVFVWAAHGCKSVQKVTINDQDAGGWQFRNGTDSKGLSVCFVEFDNPVDEGVVIRAYGEGKFHPLTGELMTNPADVLWDIVSNIAETGADYSDFGDFRSECHRLDISIHGSLEDERATIQSEIRDLCESVGAIFCSTAPGYARIFPQPSLKSPVFTVDAAYPFSVRGQRRAVVNDLVVNFDFDDGRSRKTLRLEVPSSIAKYGRNPKTINAYWLKGVKVAYEMAARYLGFWARITWQVEARDLDRVLRVGDFVTLDHPILDDEGDYMVMSVNLDLTTGKPDISLLVPVGTLPRIDIVSQSEAFPALIYASVGVSTVGDERVLNLKNEDGTPMVGAKVTLDGRFTRTTDSAGRVAFPVDVMPLGEHTLAITTVEGQVFTLTVIVQ